MAEDPVVVLGGVPFGVKLYTDGVLVVSLSEVDTKVGAVSPAKNAGLKVRDLIWSINGEEVYTNEQVSALVKSSAGKTMALRIKRDGVELELRFCVAYSQSEQCFKAGIWVRDSSAGIGTLTFYDPDTGMIAGLGHAVCDVDTGEIVQGMSSSPIIQNGKLVGAVTRVLVNDPTKGYGIFAENMLETAQSVAEKQQLKEAS